jgi:prolyl-tRNA synthetase
MARRDTKEKSVIQFNEAADKVPGLFEDIQKGIFQKALTYRKEMTTPVDSYSEFKELLDSKGGFFLAHWDGSPETEEKIKEETKATIRCIPLDAKAEDGKCMVTGKPSKRRVVFARAY